MPKHVPKMCQKTYLPIGLKMGARRRNVMNKQLYLGELNADYSPLIQPKAEEFSITARGNRDK